MQFGTLQWHPDGTLVAMGPDHPVTGGYLQPATVVSDDLWKLAQLAPGERGAVEGVREPATTQTGTRMTSRLASSPNASAGDDVQIAV